jgi:hypothetical protein
MPCGLIWVRTVHKWKLLIATSHQNSHTACGCNKLQKWNIIPKDFCWAEANWGDLGTARKMKAKKTAICRKLEHSALVPAEGIRHGYTSSPVFSMYPYVFVAGRNKHSVLLVSRVVMDCEILTELG